MMKQAQVEENMSNLTSASGEASTVSSSCNNRNDNNGGIYSFPPPLNQSQPPKKKRNQPGHPDPEAEVIALSPRSLLATNRFVCEICNKGFQRDQNLQLHRRGHNLPWKLKQRTSKEIRKKVYVCPEISCVHHDPSRALGDLTGIKKHFCRKHGEKKWKCEKCSKKYAVQSDWKAHSKTCGTREYRCDCGTLFSRRDSFITHRAFCDALAEESARSIPGNNNNNNNNNNVNMISLQNSSASAILSHHMNLQQVQSHFNNNTSSNEIFQIKKEQQNFSLIRSADNNILPPWLGGPPPPPGQPTPSSSIFQDFQQNPNPSTTTTTTVGATAPLPPYHPPPSLSATALLQKAAQMGSSTTSSSPAGQFIRPHHPVHVSAAAATTTGFGLNLSSRDHHQLVNGLASFGNKAAATVSVTAGDGEAPAGDTSNPPPSSPRSSLLHDMMMNNPAFGFEDNMAPFGGFLKIPSSKIDHESLDNFHATLDQFNHREGGISDGMTRDFLGLRPLSQSEILNGLTNCMNNNNNNGCNDLQHQNQNQTQKSWQG